MSETITSYWTDYNTTLDPTITTGTVTSGDTYSYGYTCPGCGNWVWGHCYHSCYYHHENKTELAYKLLRKLVEKKIIHEPKDYAAFCKILEEIRDSL